MRRTLHLQAPPLSAQSGFTLIELMVVVVLVAILAMLATPSWNEMRIRAALRTGVNDFTSSLQFARSEAVRLNSAVTICPSNDGANCTDTSYDQGWIVRTGPRANAANQIILQDTLPNRAFRLNVRGGADQRLTYLPNGLPASNFNGVTLEACPQDTHFVALTRVITINRTGKVTLSNPGACTI